MTAVFIDLDGTLTDPKTGIVRCIQHALGQLGKPVPKGDELNWCIGPPLRPSLEQLTGDPGLGEEALTIYRQRFSEIGLYENEMYRGIEDALSEIRDRTTALFLATSKPTVFAARILDHFNLMRFFEGVFGSELDGTRNEKADILAYALAQTGKEPAKSVMVGDRRHDIEGAHVHKMPSIGVLYGYGSEAELSAAGADVLVCSPERLPAAVFDILDLRRSA